jgi:hypothetical protein
MQFVTGSPAQLLGVLPVTMAGSASFTVLPPL